MRTYHIYILTNKVNSTLYIGVTGNLTRRIYEHKNKLVEGFSKKYNLTKLVYAQEFNDVQEALNCEKKLKKFNRKKKKDIVDEFNKDWREILL